MNEKKITIEPIFAVRAVASYLQVIFQNCRNVDKKLGDQKVLGLHVYTILSQVGSKLSLFSSNDFRDSVLIFFELILILNLLDTLIPMYM